MAKIETTFIRPKEEFNVDTGKAKVTYDGYQNNPHEIELSEDLEGDVESVINDTFKENDNNNVAFTDNEGHEHELITSEGFGDALNEALPAALANAQVITTTWAELKDLRDNKQLIAGSLYRITDYNCTTTQENTRSAGHQFDIVLLALSNNKLAEEGWAMMNESNIYDVTFADGVTKKCYIYCISVADNEWNIVDCETLMGVGAVVEGDGEDFIINESNKSAICVEDSEILNQEDLTYNYFQNSKLEAWKVWYCLDNDTTRFTWAQEKAINVGGVWYPRYKDGDIGELLYWYDASNDEGCYTKSENPSVDDYIYDSQGNEDGTIEGVKKAGRGVIYRLIDEFNNDVAYDFKSIQFVRPLTDGAYNADTGTDTWVYTFNGWDEENDVAFDASLNFDRANNNFVGSPFHETFALADVVFISGSSDSRINSSNICTINNALSVSLVGCEGAIINAANSDYLYCDDTLVTTDADDPAIYIINKKVLTET